MPRNAFEIHKATPRRVVQPDWASHHTVSSYCLFAARPPSTEQRPNDRGGTAHMRIIGFGSRDTGSPDQPICPGSPAWATRRKVDPHGPVGGDEFATWRRRRGDRW
jgi:hypothetical protein